MIKEIIWNVNHKEDDISGGLAMEDPVTYRGLRWSNLLVRTVSNVCFNWALTWWKKWTTKIWPAFSFMEQMHLIRLKHAVLKRESECYNNVTRKKAMRSWKTFILLWIFVMCKRIHLKHPTRHWNHHMWKANKHKSSEMTKVNGKIHEVTYNFIIFLCATSTAWFLALKFAIPERHLIVDF